MIYYVLAISSYGLASVFLLRTHSLKSRALLFIIGLVPMIFLAVMRGNVGTDTATYIDIISDIKSSSAAPVELGFVLLVKCLLYLSSDPSIVLSLLALITIGLLVLGSILSSQALFVSALCIVPIYFFDMTMNGVRYGLSFACAMMAIALFYRKQLLISIGFAVLAVMLHVSGLLLFGMMILLADDRSELKRWVVISLLLGLLLTVMQNIDGILVAFGFNVSDDMGAHLAEKIPAYLKNPSPRFISGFAQLAMSLIVFFILRCSDTIHSRARPYQLWALFTLIIAAFILTKFNYVGLRVQSLVLFFMLVVMQFKPSFSHIKNVSTIRENKTLYLMSLVGLIGFAYFFKTMLFTEGGWLPYLINPMFGD